MFCISLIRDDLFLTCTKMITAKTTALILAMTIVVAATQTAFATSIGGGSGGIAVITATGQNATNSDDDTNTQGNLFAPYVNSEQKSEQNSGTQSSAFVLNALTGNNSNTQPQHRQLRARSQSNTVNDNDEQENNQCASGPSVLNLASCLDIDLSLLRALRAD
jgi:hypothetical protein